MNKYKIVQIVCWTIVFVVFIGLAIWFITRGSTSFTGRFSIENLRGPYEEKARYRIDTSKVESMELSWTAGEIIIRPYDGEEIELVEYAQRDLDEDEKLSYNVDHNTMTISFCKKQFRILDPMPPKKLEIFVPEKLAADFNDVFLNCVSSTVDVYNIKAQSFYAKTVSGEVFLTDITADKSEVRSTSGTLELDNIMSSKLELKTVSGEIRVQRLTAADVSAHSTSGEITLTEVTTEQLDFDTVSGEVEFDGSFQMLTANTTSGDLDITVDTVPNSINIKTVSGEVNLMMPASTDFGVYYKTVSGDFHSGIPMRSLDESTAAFKIKTTSGDIKITELK